MSRGNDRGNGNAGKIYTHTEPPDGTEAYKIGDQAIDDRAVQCNTDGSCLTKQALMDVCGQITEPVRVAAVFIVIPAEYLGVHNGDPHRRS